MTTTTTTRPAMADLHYGDALCEVRGAYRVVVDGVHQQVMQVRNATQARALAREVGRVLGHGCGWPNGTVFSVRVAHVAAGGLEVDVRHSVERPNPFRRGEVERVMQQVGDGWFRVGPRGAVEPWS